MARLGDIATVITKGTTPTSVGYNFQNDGINFIKIESINENGGFIDDKFDHISDECHKKLKRSQLQENDILFSIAGAIGRTAIVTNSILPANTNQALSIIRIPQGIINYSFLLYVLQSAVVYEQAEKRKQGVAQLNLSLKDISELVIPDIPLAQQQDIVENLDKVNNLIFLRKQQLSKLDKLVKSRFIEMFGNPVSNDKGWQHQAMAEVAPSYAGLGDNSEIVWLLNLDMVEAQTGRILDYLYVEKEQVGTSTCAFDEGNVLYSKLRPYLNKVVVPTKKGYCTTELVPLRPNAKLNRQFLAYLLRSEAFVSFINEKVAGAKMPRVSMSVFRDFECILPPMDLQKEFAAFVDQTDKSKFEIQKSLEQLETLKKSLMQKYFG